MSLNGKEPVIIFKLYDPHAKWKKGEPNSTRIVKTGEKSETKSLVGQEISLKDWQQMTEEQRDIWHTPIPIPIYLGGLLGGEELTGIALDDANQTITFGGTSVGGLCFQKNMANDFTISLRARRDNPIMIALLAVISQLISLIPKQRYGIIMYYDSAFVLNGIVKSITQQTINNTNIKLVQIVISERAEEEKTNKDSENSNSPIPSLGGNGYLPNLN